MLTQAKRQLLPDLVLEVDEKVRRVCVYVCVKDVPPSSSVYLLTAEDLSSEKCWRLRLSTLYAHRLFFPPLLTFFFTGRVCYVQPCLL